MALQCVTKLGHIPRSYLIYDMVFLATRTDTVQYYAYHGT